MATKYPQLPIHDDPLAEKAMLRNHGAGFFYFSEDTMRGFGSKLHEGHEVPNSDVIVVVMSNKSRPMAGFPAVLDGRRHYYLMAVEKTGHTRHLSGPLKYSVTEETGYWFRLAEAREHAIKISLGCAELEMESY